MNESEIRALVQQEIRKNENLSRFSLRNIPYHVHNGTDSPFIYQPTATYTGVVPFVPGTLFVNAFLPQGWTVEYDLVDEWYVITHNLGTRLYSVVVTKKDNSGSGGIIPKVSYNGPNSFTVQWRDASLNPATASFFFTVTQINSKRNGAPTYESQLDV